MKYRASRFFTLPTLHLVILSFLFLTAAALATAPVDFSGHWEGTVALPGTPLEVHVDLRQDNGVWSGKIDIPQQNAKGLTLDPITIKGTVLTFTIRGVPSDPTFEGTWQNGAIEGNFTQGPLKLPFTLGRGKISTLSAQRPQEPKAPFPYAQRPVAFGNGSVHLAGTLTLPAGAGPFPAVELISGSGPQDRNGEIAGHKPFLLLADRLTRAGIAVLRVDDRGVGGSNGGSVDDSTLEDALADVLAGVSFLQTQPEIARGRIGLIGHSAGGNVAAMAAAKSKDVAFIIMLAGTGVPGDQVLLKQTELIARASGADERTIRKETDDLSEILSAVAANIDSKTLAAKVRRLAVHQVESQQADKRLTTQELDASADSESRSLTTPWFRSFLKSDPRVALRKVIVPTLVLAGELDRQVSPEQNLPEIEKALREAGNGDVTVRRLPGLNHLFQTAATGSPQEYGAIDETFNENAIDIMKTWIAQRFGRAPARSSTTPATR